MDYSSLFAAAFVTLIVALFGLQFLAAFGAALCKRNEGDGPPSSINALAALFSFVAGVVLTGAFCWKLAHVVYVGWAA